MLLQKEKEMLLWNVAFMTVWVKSGLWQGGSAGKKQNVKTTGLSYP